MAKAGNHGQIIPRDRALLTRLYWDEKRSLPAIGRLFGVTHKSVERVMRELGIDRRRSGPVRPAGCIVCGAPLHLITHAGNGARYGRRCEQHRREHYAALARDYNKSPEVRVKRQRQFQRWYDNGPINPTGEGQWISKSKALLRSAKRLLRTPTREASPSQSAASRPDRTSRE